MIMDKEDMVKERAKLLSLRICQALVSLGFYDDVRQVLGQLNVDTQNMSDEPVSYTHLDVYKRQVQITKNLLTPINAFNL